MNFNRMHLLCVPSDATASTPTKRFPTGTSWLQERVCHLRLTSPKPRLIAIYWAKKFPLCIDRKFSLVCWSIKFLSIQLIQLESHRTNWKPLIFPSLLHISSFPNCTGSAKCDLNYDNTKRHCIHKSQFHKYRQNMGMGW